MARSIDAKGLTLPWQRRVSAFLAATLLGSLVPTAKAAPLAPALPGPAALPPVLVYPPKDATAARPVVVMLHGMCDVPANECPLLAEAFTERAWLVCPRGDTPCDGGGATWSQSKRGRIPEQALDYLRARFGNQIDEKAGHTLAGFSLGAFAAIDAFQGGQSPFRHLILIGAKVEPAVTTLLGSGVTDVVLMAGQWDMTYQHMARKSQALVRQGLDSRFVDLGPVGHQFPTDINQRLRLALTWINAR
jgi:predicted esterase